MDQLLPRQQRVVAEVLPGGKGRNFGGPWHLLAVRARAELQLHLPGDNIEQAADFLIRVIVDKVPWREPALLHGKNKLLLRRLGEHLQHLDVAEVFAPNLVRDLILDGGGQFLEHDLLLGAPLQVILLIDVPQVVGDFDARCGTEVLLLHELVHDF